MFLSYLLLLLPTDTKRPYHNGNMLVVRLETTALHNSVHIPLQLSDEGPELVTGYIVDRNNHFMA